MQIKDVGLFLILGVLLDLIGIGCSTGILLMYKVQPGLRAMFISLEVVLGLSLFFKLVTFNSTVYRAPSKLSCIMFLSMVVFTVGTVVVGISLGKANYWEKTLFGGDGASFPLLFLGADILIYLVYIFVIIRCKETINEKIRKGEVNEKDGRKIRDVLCGDLYQENDDFSTVAGGGKYVHDNYTDRRKKPSFNNKKKFASTKNSNGARRRELSNSSFDDAPAHMEEGRPILHNPSPKRVVAQPVQAVVVGVQRPGAGPTGPISPVSPSRALEKKSARQAPASPPRQYVQTPSLLDSSMSSAAGLSPRRGRVVP